VSITVWRMAPDDAAAFARIAEGVFDQPIDPVRLRDYLATPGHLLVLAFDGDLIVGQCAGVLHRHPDKVTELYIDEVGTGDNYLRRGVASLMLGELFAWGRELGCAEAWLGTELDNEAANGFYRRWGGAEDTIKYYEFKL
jgi:ribosomal protein S18 acetylase RimI-like enzyme